MSSDSQASRVQRVQTDVTSVYASAVQAIGKRFKQRNEYDPIMVKTAIDNVAEFYDTPYDNICMAIMLYAFTHGVSISTLLDSDNKVVLVNPSGDISMVSANTFFDKVAANLGTNVSGLILSRLYRYVDVKAFEGRAYNVAKQLNVSDEIILGNLTAIIPKDDGTRYLKGRYEEYKREALDDNNHAQNRVITI